MSEPAASALILGMHLGEFWLGLATLFAVLVGPVLAVLVTRYIDERRAARQRKLDIFKTLMRTRRMPVHFEHVGALNLVEVEFVDEPKVVEAWKNYLNNLGEQLPSLEQKERHDAAIKRRDGLLTKLIYEISRVLKFRVEQLEILEGNYVPQGWSDDDWEQRLVRRGLLNVLSNKSPIAIQVHQPTGGNSPYPPPPKSGGNGS